MWRNRAINNYMAKGLKIKIKGVKRTQSLDEPRKGIKQKSVQKKTYSIVYSHPKIK